MANKWRQTSMSVRWRIKLIEVNTEGINCIRAIGANKSWARQFAQNGPEISTGHTVCVGIMEPKDVATAFALRVAAVKENRKFTLNIVTTINFSKRTLTITSYEVEMDHVVKVRMAEATIFYDKLRITNDEIICRFIFYAYPSKIRKSACVVIDVDEPEFVDNRRECLHRRINVSPSTGIEERSFLCQSSLTVSQSKLITEV